MHEIEVSREVKNLGHRNAAALIRKAAEKALAAEQVQVPCLISVMLTDAEGIHRVNREFRGVDRETDVLSFPLCEGDHLEINSENHFVLLGDIVISMEMAFKQAKMYGHKLEREVAFLTVHSMLHLLGYDHLDEGPQKAQMRQREEAIASTIAGMKRD
jgi:probable rRNA maturation factor